jgi:hypothetical protein
LAQSDVSLRLIALVAIGGTADMNGGVASAKSVETDPKRQDNGVPSQSHDLDTYLNARTPVETARLIGEAAPQRAVVLLRL